MRAKDSQSVLEKKLVAEVNDQNSLKFFQNFLTLFSKFLDIFFKIPRQFPDREKIWFFFLIFLLMHMYNKIKVKITKR